MDLVEVRAELVNIADMLSSTGRIDSDPTITNPTTLVAPDDAMGWRPSSKTPPAPQMGWRPPYPGDPSTFRGSSPQMSTGQVAMLALGRLEKLINELPEE